MLHASIDSRIKDDTMDELRRSLYAAQANNKGAQEFVRGHGEGFSEGMEFGYNRAVEDFLTLILDFAKGNRS